MTTPRAAGQHQALLAKVSIGNMKPHPNSMGSVCKDPCEYWCIKPYSIKSSYCGIFLSKVRCLPELVALAIPEAICVLRWPIPRMPETALWEGNIKKKALQWLLSDRWGSLHFEQRITEKPPNTTKLTEFPVFFQLYGSGGDCFLILFHLLTQQTSQSGIFSIKILDDAVMSLPSNKLSMSVASPETLEDKV